MLIIELSPSWIMLTSLNTRVTLNNQINQSCLVISFEPWNAANQLIFLCKCICIANLSIIPCNITCTFSCIMIGQLMQKCEVKWTRILNFTVWKPSGPVIGECYQPFKQTSCSCRRGVGRGNVKIKDVTYRSWPHVFNYRYACIAGYL